MAFLQPVSNLADESGELRRNGRGHEGVCLNEIAAVRHLQSFDPQFRRVRLSLVHKAALSSETKPVIVAAKPVSTAPSLVILTSSAWIFFVEPERSGEPRATGPAVQRERNSRSPPQAL